MTTSREPKHPRIAVIGCGRWGANHVRVFGELGHLAAVCDADAGRLAAAAERYPGVSQRVEPNEVFDDADIDAVVIAAPAVVHAALARAALEASKHVLVEKPMAMDVAEAVELCELAQRKGLTFGVGHVLEYHPAVARLQDLAEAGELGRLRYLYSNRLNFGTIRTEENVLWSFAPHDIAIMRRILGSAPTSVSSHGSAYIDPRIADVTMTYMEFGSDVRGHIHVSWIHPFKEHRFVIIGERQMAVFDDSAPWPEKLTLYEHEVDWADGRLPVARKAAGKAVPLEETEPLRAQAVAFIEAVRAGTQPLADGRSGAEVLAVLFAAQRSIDAGGAPQTLEPPTASVHPSAVVDDGVVIGEGTKVWHFVHVSEGVRLGRDCVLGQNVFVGRGVEIGDRVRIQNNVSVYEGVVLADDVFVGPSVVFTNVRSPRAAIDQKDAFLPTTVGAGASIGANATIVCGNAIGRGALVGAGAVVTHDVPDHAIVVGNPATFADWVCVCGFRLASDGDLVCGACGTAFVRAGDGIAPS